MDGARRLEELQLIQFTLLPDEVLTFLDSEGPVWSQLLQDYGENAGSAEPFSWPSAPPHIQVKPLFSKIWFQLLFASSHTTVPSVSVKGEDVTRAEQERWQNIIQEKLTDEITTSEVPVYELLCLHLLPLLRDEIPAAAAVAIEEQAVDSDNARPKFHALFTSHHLISPKKRRALQQWSGELAVAGFAKVGYPGVIYAQGDQGSVEEFVENVKAMQWLALRLRFSEPLPVGERGEAQGWTEFEKVGEVVEAMRRLGLEDWIVEMGIGSRNS
ncbi:RWD domain-containing protein 2B [Mycena sanguinolenta]|uniref:RWD domain-containing protein 2B n=1 Tax=Mycena sanguinolenta TaxID=230812 RepID=A0A8H6WX34_9AGAR|nr:RWD domain-containing protein 2B [Mycena sanguinolenta]